MIIYNGKNSLKDFDLYIASKDIPVPQRKRITETVPYMSGLWDFSYLDGVDQYDAITLKYDFDVIAVTKQELNEQKHALLDWLHGVGDKKLYDTDISSDYYYNVYQAQASWSETDTQGLLSVEFLCYPFRLKDYSFTKSWYSNPFEAFATVKIDDNFNDRGRSIVITATVDGSVVVKFAGATLGLTTGTHTFSIPSGTTSFTVEQGVYGTDIYNEITLVYREEVL